MQVGYCQYNFLCDQDQGTNLSIVQLHPAGNKSKLNKAIILLLSVYLMTVCYKGYVKLWNIILNICFLYSFILNMSFSKLQTLG